MKTATLLSALTFTIAALAAPATKRADTNVLICDDKDFTGTCQDFPSETSKCVGSFPENFTNSISSVQPFEGSFCYFFTSPDCATDGDFFHVGYPGVADLSVTPVNGPEGSTRNFEDKLSSFFCIVDQK